LESVFETDKKYRGAGVRFSFFFLIFTRKISFQFSFYNFFIYRVIYFFMKRIFCLLSLALLLALSTTHTSQAQILNIEKDRQDDEVDKPQWHINAELEFNVVQQINRLIEFGGDLSVLHQRPKHDYILMGNYELVNVLQQNSEEEEEVVSAGFLHARANLFRDNKVSYELFTQYQRDNVRGMESRFLAGGVFRIHLLRKEKHNLALGLGSMYEDESWAFGGVEGTTQLIKMAHYLSLHSKLSEGVELIFATYYQSRWDTPDLPRVSNDLTLNFKVKEHFYFSTQFTSLYDAAPIVPIDKWIYRIGNGIKIEF